MGENKELIGRLNSFLDRLANDAYAGTKFEADGDTLRDAMAALKLDDRKPTPTPPSDDAGRVAELEAQLALAYGLLWHVNAGMDAPHGTPSLTPERGAMESRKILRDLLTHEQRGDGINAARNYMAALAAEKGGKE